MVEGQALGERGADCGGGEGACLGGRGGGGVGGLAGIGDWGDPALGEIWEGLDRGVVGVGGGPAVAADSGEAEHDGRADVDRGVGVAGVLGEFGEWEGLRALGVGDQELVDGQGGEGAAGGARWLTSSAWHGGSIPRILEIFSGMGAGQVSNDRDRWGDSPASQGSRGTTSADMRGKAEVTWVGS